MEAKQQNLKRKQTGNKLNEAKILLQNKKEPKSCLARKKYDAKTNKK
jgi:hypothetical protein